MEKACSICNHPNRTEINQLILQGYSMMKIATEFNVSEISLFHHMEDHLNCNQPSLEISEYDLDDDNSNEVDFEKMRIKPVFQTEVQSNLTNITQINPN